MSKLKENIDRILGSSLRCLLPSYWWKRIFGLLVEEIDDVRSTANSKATKSEVASLSNSVDALSDKVDNIDSGNKITVDSALSLGSTNPVQNKVVTEAIQELQSLPFSGGVLITDDTMAMAYLRAMFDTPKKNANIAGYILYEEHNDSGGVVRYSLGVVDSVDINENTDTASLEYNIHGKRYRNIYNIASGALVETVELSSGGLPIYLCIDYGVGIISPPDREREVNKGAYNALQNIGSSVPPYCILTIYKNGAKVGEVSMGIEHYSTGTNLYFYTRDWDNGNTFDLLKYRLHEDGSVTYEGLVQADAEMSDTSTSPVQNKVIKKYVDTEVAKKVDKVSGKGLSTEDFTTLLKTKLEGLENYDDTTLTNAISSLETRLNTLVSGDTSAAIESFNEVIAFLENLTDTQDLSSIIASIEQQINAKQDKVNDLDDIRSGASLGKTSLQEHQDISHLATKEELQNVVDDILETEEVYAAAVNDLNSRLVETNAAIDTEISTRESLATEVQTITNRVSSNEEVTATSYNELNERINNNYQEGIDTYATKVELNNEIASINTAIIENEEVIAATLNDLLSQIEALRVRIEQLENA